ncbi:hypothetical protein [Symbiopectobacterium sp. RP]|uniref:hypothetical protein n=1 Tax=Symbiopectobacterium sp. RP TaxID=3248553 RepID=UPI003D2650F2
MITISCIFLPHIRALAVIIFKSVGYNACETMGAMKIISNAKRLSVVAILLWRNAFM